MLLACCFREPKPKHEKKIKTKNGKKLPAAASDEDAYVLTKSLISAPMGITGSSSAKEVEAAEEFTIQTKRQISRGESRDQRSPAPTAEPPPHGQARNRVRALVEEETPARAKEEAKQQGRSAALRAPKSFNASTPVSKDPSHHAQICSPNFTNISAIKKKEEVKDVRRMLATPEDLDESYISLSKINHVSSSTNSSKESPEKPTDNEGLQNDNLTFTKKEKNDDDGHIKQSRENQELKQAIEEQKRRFELQEKAINALKHEYESQIERLKKEHNSRLQEEKNNFHIKMLEDKEKHRKEVESAKIIAKNSANETISQLNKQIVSERAKMFSEQQETKKRMEEEFKMKEARLEQSLACLGESVTMVERREGEWQQEKEDILAEVQRLKAEASKMVSILAAEYEEENLSEEKKRSLSAEVYSLQLVVEMRTAEVRGLREKLATSQQQLEDAAVTRNSLQKAHARIEDLKEQLKKKVEQEQRAAAEKWELESSVSESNKVAERMSMNVEELQWRIRNNYELPVGIFANKLVERDAVSDKKSEDTDHISDNIATDRVQASNRNQFSVSREMMEATSTDESPAVGDDAAVRMTGGVSDASPSSDICLEYDVIRANEEANQEEQSDGNNNLNDDGDDDIVAEESIDRDSLDEGLGDISSDGEVTAESPELKNHDIDNNNQEDEAADLRAKTNAVPDLVTNRLSSETEKERRPSRISFETPL